jgi:peptidoglycan/LPS O-acetylase OafA/YrhL
MRYGRISMRTPNDRAPEVLKVAKLPHIRELDGLRAVAIVTVFIGHAHMVAKFPGGFGVTIFFFLSGFLITTLMRIERAKTGALRLKDFYIRRLLRIQPPLLLSMAAIGVLIATGALSVETKAIQIIGQLLLVTNYMPSFGQDGGLPIPLWSLAVEEHFYLVFPLLYVVLSKRISSRDIALTCIGISICVLLMRIFNLLALDITVENYYWSHTRVDSILFGCILALWGNPVLDHEAWKPNALWVTGAILAILGGFLITAPLFRLGFLYSIQGAALLVLFSWVLQKKGLVSQVLNTRFVQLIGLYSYTIYLVHYAFIYLVREQLPQAPVIVQALVAGTLDGFCSRNAPLGRTSAGPPAAAHEQGGRAGHPARRSRVAERHARARDRLKTRRPGSFRT